MGDVLGLVMEQYSCDIQIRALQTQLGEWEAAAAGLAEFRMTVASSESDLTGSVSAAVGAVQGLEDLSEKCLTAAVYGEEMTGELRMTGLELAGGAFARLEDRIERELASYRQKMEEGRRNLALAEEKRAMLEEQIRILQEEEP